MQQIEKDCFSVAKRSPYIYDVSISGFTRSSIYICDISSLRVKILNEFKNIVVATNINISGEKSASRISDIPSDVKKEASITTEDDKLFMGVNYS